MTSYGDVQYPQNPYLNTAPGYNYDDITQSRGGHFYRQPIIHEDPYTSSGSSGYADTAPSGYGAQHYPEHLPTGPSGPDFSAPAEHAPHPTKSTFFGLKKGSSSVMGALTLLSFFFFLNSLQQCLKEHMDTMNPTVMVLKNIGLKDRNDKLADMDARESTSTAPASTPAAEHVVIEPDNLMGNVPVATIAATLTSVQHNRPVTENVEVIDSSYAHQPYATPGTVGQHNLNPYDYPNRSEVPPTSTYSNSQRYRPQHHYDDHYYPPYEDDRFSWSHRPHSRYRQDPYDSSSYWDRYEDRDFPNHDSYDDTPYMRIF